MQGGTTTAGGTPQGVANPPPLPVFVAARTILRATSGGDAVASAYHAGLVAPFCMAATRDYFQAILSQ